MERPRASEYRNWRPARRRSFPSVLLRIALRVTRWLTGRFPHDTLALVALLRARADGIRRFIPRLPPACVCDPVDGDGFRGYWMHPRGLDDLNVLLYVHGGGFIMGSPNVLYRDLIPRLSIAAGARVMAVDYSKAPEHPFPAAVNEVLAAYEYLLKSYPASRIAVGGDSAGGGLTLGAALKIRERGLPMPGALITISACADLSGSGDSVTANARRDYVIPVETIPPIAEVYLGGTPANDPIASPVFADFHGFPPTLFQVGSEEVFLDDSIRVARKMTAAGVPVLLDIWDRQPHVWHLYAAFLPEARSAIADIGRFARSQLRGNMAGRVMADAG